MNISGHPKPRAKAGRTALPSSRCTSAGAAKTPRRDRQWCGPAAVTGKTAEQQLHERLAAREARYNLMIEGSGAGLWEWDITDDIFYGSPRFVEILSLDEQYRQQNFAFFEKRLHPDERDDVLAVLDAHLKTDIDFNVECRLRDAADRYVWVHMRGMAVRDRRNKPLLMVGSIIDISKHKQAIAQLIRSNESLEQFAYICSHDLKEPARIVENFSQLLMARFGDALPFQAREYMEYIRDSAGRMQNMIKGILDYSQTGCVETRFERVNVQHMLKDIQKSLKPKISECNATITCDKLPVIKADRTRLYQIFQNLLVNSLKFCDREPRIHIGVKKQETHWCFHISDNGIGMDPEHTEAVFGVFKRLHNTGDISGTGIGLSICQKAVAKHDGRIWVESLPGEGSTFYFTIARR